MPIPVAISVPAAIAGISYLNARTSAFYDWQTFGSGVVAQIKCVLMEKKDRLNGFYVLEDHARGKLANNVFLIYEGKQWTFKETYETVLKYGTWFKTKYGIKSHEVVAMDFMNSEKFIFIWLGLWAIGAKPAFINYNLTGKALTHCVGVSSSRLVLIDPQVADKITQEVRDELPNVQFDIFTAELESEVDSTEGVRVKDSERSDPLAQSLAILIYTSGTTGLPKGAIVSWKKVVVSMFLFPAWMGFTSKDVFYTCMPFYHSSAALLAVCTSLRVGATLSIGKKFSTKTFWVDCRSSKATIIQYVGETCRYLLAAPPQIDPITAENLDSKNSVRIAFGNGLRPDVWNRFKERFDIDAIAEFYSATEGAGATLNYSRNDFSKGAIGRTGTLVSFLLEKSNVIVELDWETEQPLRDPKTGFCKRAPTGMPGELLYKLDENDIEKGFQGYFNNKKSTDDKIMRDVLAKGDAFFRTGDVISRDAEGRTFFNDRIGDTFRWKSENVSTSEVSEALGNHLHIQEANVYGVELPHHDGRAGCAAIVLTRGPDERVLTDIADHVHKCLPRFAVPLFLRVVKEMQITGTNKQQKHILRSEGVNPSRTGSDETFWLRNKTYVKFSKKDWEELNGGSVKL